MEPDFCKKAVFIILFVFVLIMISYAADCEWLTITATTCLPITAGICSFIYRAKCKSGSDKKISVSDKRSSNKPMKKTETSEKSHIIILANNDEIIDYEISKL